MKKIGIINAPISSVIAHLAHTDMLTVADAGLPIPVTTKRVDLALKPGVPGFLETLEVVLSEMYVEKAYVSSDIIKCASCWGMIPLRYPSHRIQAAGRFQQGGRQNW